MMDITDEKWAAEFDVLDKDSNGYITFDEFCMYTVSMYVSVEGVYVSVEGMYVSVEGVAVA